MHFLIFIYF